MNIAACLPHLVGLRVEAAFRFERSLHLRVASRAHTARCPLCRRRSARIHSRYRRTLVDLPWGGLPVVLHLCVRRFVCATPTCPRRIFAERFPSLVAPRVLQTAPAQLACQQIGLAVGGQAGARLEPCWGCPRVVPRSCGGCSPHRSFQRHARGCSGSMTGPGAAATATGRSYVTWSGTASSTASSTSSPTAPPRASPPG